MQDGRLPSEENERSLQHRSSRALCQASVCFYICAHKLRSLSLRCLLRCRFRGSAYRLDLAKLNSWIHGISRSEWTLVSDGESVTHKGAVMSAGRLYTYSKPLQTVTHYFLASGIHLCLKVDYESCGLVTAPGNHLFHCNRLRYRGATQSSSIGLTLDPRLLSLLSSDMRLDNNLAIETLSLWLCD
jgi:hypothetical protein